jgi:hypothetical protein
MADSVAAAKKASNKELGRLTAVTLMEEMRFLGELVSRVDNDDLIDPPEKRPDFQTIFGEDAAKSTLSGDFIANLAGLKYCVGDGDVGKTEVFDIDHTHAFSDIERKQKGLLTYLNNPANADFAEGFLSARDINLYFGRDPGSKNSPKSIKGARRFYKLCYNDIDNLLLLCHACNLRKSAKDSLEWFKQQEPFLGKAFVNAVNKAGGLHDGIIVKKVMNPGDATRLISINLDYEFCLMPEPLPKNWRPVNGKFYFRKEPLNKKLKYTVFSPENMEVAGELDIEVEGELNKNFLKDVLESKKSEILDETSKRGHTGRVDCTLHVGDPNVFGMGQYVRKWFEKENPGYRADIVKAYKDIWLELKAIFQVRLTQEGEVYRRSEGATDKLVTAVEQCIETVDKHYNIKGGVTRSTTSSPVSSSSSDDDVDKKSRLEEIDRQVKTVFKRIHAIKKFYKETLKSRSLEGVTKDDVFSFLAVSGFDNLGPQEQEKALRKIKDEIIRIDKDKPITKDNVQTIIQHSVKTYSFEVVESQREVERQRADEAERGKAAVESELATMAARLSLLEGNADKNKLDDTSIPLPASSHFSAPQPQLRAFNSGCIGEPLPKKVKTGNPAMTIGEVDKPDDSPPSSPSRMDID